MCALQTLYGLIPRLSDMHDTGWSFRSSYLSSSTCSLSFHPQLEFLVHWENSVARKALGTVAAACHVESTSSLLINEVKQHWAHSLQGWYIHSGSNECCYVGVWHILRKCHVRESTRGICETSKLLEYMHSVKCYEMQHPIGLPLQKYARKDLDGG